MMALKPSAETVVYVSGPMTGIENFNHGAFFSTASRLRAQGFTVLNPAVIPTTLEYERCMEIALAMVRSSDALVMLEGWEDSKGANREYELARELNLTVFEKEGENIFLFEQ